MIIKEARAERVTSLVANLVGFLEEEVQLCFLGRREGFVDPTQMTEEGRSEDFSFSFRQMNRTGYKIWLLYSWHMKDEVSAFYIREFLQKTLQKKQMLLEQGETEFLPYLISKSSATKAFEESFQNRKEEIFGQLRQKDKKKNYIFPTLFIRVKPKKKSKVIPYSGYCSGYKTNTPAKKDSGENLRKEIQIQWNKKKLLYQLLFDLKPRIDEALIHAGFTDNYEQIEVLLEYKIKIKYELETL